MFEMDVHTSSRQSNKNIESRIVGNHVYDCIILVIKYKEVTIFSWYIDSHETLSIDTASNYINKT
ncbi:hypothetical protein JMUB7504_27500 [Staphylococcus aureus]